MAPRRSRLLSKLLFVVLVLFILCGVTRLLRGTTTGQQALPLLNGIPALRVRNLFSNIYAFKVGDKVVLIDAGVDEQGKSLDVLLSAFSASRDSVSDIFLTHGHFDHVAASPLCTKARIHVGQADVEQLAQRTQATPAAARWMSKIFSVGPIEANAPISQRSEFPFTATEKLVAIPFAGHTAGSYLYFFNGVLFAGDSLQINGDRLELAMAAFSQDMASDRSNAAHIEELLAGLKVETICTGHQGCTPPIAGRAEAMLKELASRFKQ